jgi:Tfp pilus assembly protein PilO
MLEEKTAGLDNYKKSQAELKEFIAQIHEPINEDNLMNLLTDFAVKRQIQIESFSPSQRKNTPLHETAGLTLNLSAGDYKNLWLFIHDIEESAYPIHIGACRISRSDQGSNSNREGSQFKVQLEIFSVSLKKE